MRFLLSSLLLLLGFCQLNAQQDPQAKKVLAKFSSVAKAYSSIRMTYTLTVDDRQTKHKSSLNGSVLMKGKKFRITTPETEIYSDGKDVWNYIKNANEVNISRVNKKADDEESFITNPTRLFDIYKTSYKMMYQGKKSVYNHNCHIVDLFPQNLNKSYSRIRLIIDADTYQLVAAVSFAKSGVIYEMKTTDYQTNATIADADINFNASRYPKVEVIDMRY